MWSQSTRKAQVATIGLIQPIMFKDQPYEEEWGSISHQVEARFIVMQIKELTALVGRFSLSVCWENGPLLLQGIEFGSSWTVFGSAGQGRVMALRNAPRTVFILSKVNVKSGTKCNQTNIKPQHQRGRQTNIIKQSQNKQMASKVGNFFKKTSATLIHQT